MKGISLIGMSGSGKSTIGHLLADDLHWQFLDLDKIIAERTHRSHADILRSLGERELLRIERRTALSLDLHDSVFAPGGSIVYAPPALDMMRRETTVLHLHVPLEEIRRRIGEQLGQRGIVRLAGRTFDALYKERTALCMAWAEKSIRCEGLSEAEILEKVRETLHAIRDDLHHILEGGASAGDGEKA